MYKNGSHSYIFMSFPTIKCYHTMIQTKINYIIDLPGQQPLLHVVWLTSNPEQLLPPQ